MKKNEFMASISMPERVSKLSLLTDINWTKLLGLFVLVFFCSLQWIKIVPERDRPQTLLIPPPVDYYEFPRVKSLFQRKVSLQKVQWLSKIQFQNYLRHALPNLFHEGFNKYAGIALEAAQKYQVDPFWVLAIIWTESHFNHQSVSPVGAIGVMQVMPATGSWIANRMHREGVAEYLSGSYREGKDLRYGGIFEPRYNIEIGVYYLKYLLQRFRGNPVHATVAYNMGPGWVWLRRRASKPIGVRNAYLDKVRTAYERLTRIYHHKVRRLKTFPATNYVTYNKKWDQLPHAGHKKPLARMAWPKVG